MHFIVRTRVCSSTTIDRTIRTIQTLNITEGKAIFLVHNLDVGTLIVSCKIQEGNTLTFHWETSYRVNLEVDTSVIIQRVVYQFQRRTVGHVVFYILITSFQSIGVVRRIYLVGKYFHILDKARFILPILNSTVELQHTIFTCKAFNLTTLSRFNTRVENIHQIFFNHFGSQYRITVYMRIFQLFLQSRTRPYWSAIGTNHIVCRTGIPETTFQFTIPLHPVFNFCILHPVSNHFHFTTFTDNRDSNSQYLGSGIVGNLVFLAVERHSVHQRDRQTELGRT